MVFEKAVELAHVHPRLHIGQGKFRGFCGRNTRELMFFLSNEQSFDLSGDIHDCGDISVGVVCVPFNASSLQACMCSKSLGDPDFIVERLFMPTYGAGI
jgi:hypothetical protein